MCVGGGLCTHTHAHITLLLLSLVVIGGAICNYEREKKATAHFLSSNQGNCYEIDVPMRHTHTYYNFFFCNHCGSNLICTTKTICTVPQ